MNLANNPIFARITGRRTWPDRTMLIGGAALLIAAPVSAWLVSLLFRSLVDTDTNVFANLLVVVFLIGNELARNLVPPLTAFVAARIAARDASAEAFQLSLLTPLPSRQFVLGYLSSALYSLRWVFVGSAALTIFLITLPVFSSRAMPGVSRYTLLDPDLSQVYLAGLLFSLLSIVLSLSATGLLSVWLGLLIRGMVSTPPLAAFLSFLFLTVRDFGLFAFIAVFGQQTGIKYSPAAMIPFSLMTNYVIPLLAIFVFFRLTVRQINRRRGLQPDGLTAQIP